MRSCTECKDRVSSYEGTGALDSDMAFPTQTKTIIIFCFSLVSPSLSTWHPTDGVDAEVIAGTAHEVRKQYDVLKAAIESMRHSCGELCDTARTGRPSKYFNFVDATVDCEQIFANEHVDRPSEFRSPPQRIPKYLRNDFTYNGSATLENNFLDDSGGQTHLLIWEKFIFDIIDEQFDKKVLTGPYGSHSVENIFRHVTSKHMNVAYQHVLVIGSQTPWIEVLLLRAGARHVTTVDYVKIQSKHPRVTTLSVSEINQMFLNQSLPKFDSMVSFSSLEHSGLGRYGDALNPWGDIITMAKAWCMLPPGSRVLIGVPVGPDIISFNGCRIYGNKMLPHLFANWKQIYTEMDLSKYNEGCNWCYQPLFVLEKS